MSQDFNPKMPPPPQPPPRPQVPDYNSGNYQATNQNNSGYQNKHRVDIANIEGYKALKTIISVLNVLGYIFLVLGGLAIVVGFIYLVAVDYGILKGLMLMLGGPIVFGLFALAVFSARDNIKVKIEQLEVSYKILDALVNKH